MFPVVHRKSFPELPEAAGHCGRYIERLLKLYRTQAAPTLDLGEPYPWPTLAALIRDIQETYPRC